MSKTPKEPKSPKKPAVSVKPAAAKPAKPTYRIVEFLAENIKRLKVVRITPKGNMVELTGGNGQGKTSVLDAIMLALGGTNKRANELIRKGQTKAVVKLDIGRYIITRTLLEGGTKGGVLSIFDKESNGRVMSPQTFLDEFMGTISFDPLVFINMDEDEQIDELRRIAPTSIDIDELDREQKEDYDARRIVDREAGALKSRAAAIQVPEGTPAKRVNEEIALAALVGAGAQGEARQKAISAVHEKQNQEETAIRDAARHRERIADLKREVAQLEEAVREAEKRAAAAKTERAKLSVPDAINTEELESAYAKARATNRAVAQLEQRREVEAEMKAKLAEFAEIDTRMKERAERRDKAIAEAKMPIPGLAYGEGGVTLGGIRFANLSNGEQIRASVAIAMTSNPQIRVLRIKDGSLLDDASLAEVAKMADENDYQVWVERVDTSGKVGIVIEDGEVRG